VLVVIQLDGGNDGLNTVVPYGDEAYATILENWLGIASHAALGGTFAPLPLLKT
jgi:uncharacterized protein (DUF1501 family)